MAAHYYAVSWDQLHRDARALAWRLIDKGPYAGIVAITRGGLIPAAIIARELDVRLVESVSIVSYAAGSGGTLIEEEKEIIGQDWYPYGIEANRPSIEALLQYTHEHGLTDRRVKLEELFAPSTLRDIPLSEGQHV